MNPDLQSTLVKVALPLFAIGAVLVISKMRGFTWTEDLRLVWAKPQVMALWLAVWIVWIIIGEFAIAALGMEQPVPWRPYPLSIIVLRIAAIGILGPIAEELIMRGLIFFRIRRTALGPAGAIFICAALWAVAHLQYDWKTISMIFLDGLVLGTARERSGSTLVPMTMHVLANLFSIYQSLS